MLGAIAGDIVGSIYERHNHKSKVFPLWDRRSRFTDDTVLTLAVADCLLNQGDFAQTIRRFGRRYPRAGYAARFQRWLWFGGGPYNSWGNGSAMRVGPIPYFSDNEDQLMDLAARSAAVTHDHPQGVAGAQAVALAMWRARSGTSREDIRREIGERFGYDMTRTVDGIRPGYAFDVSCPGSVPEALICALEANDFEDALRNAVSIGGDSDTIACIAGGLAECLYGLPDEIALRARDHLDGRLRTVLEAFAARHVPNLKELFDENP